MSCSTCTPARTLPNCISELTLGTLTSVATDVHVYFRRIAGNRLERVDATTGNEGLLTVDVSDLGNFFLSNSQFECWATLADAESTNDREVITIGQEELECLMLTFEPVAGQAYEAQTVIL